MDYKIRQGNDLAIEIPVLDDNSSKVDMTLATVVRVALSVKGLIVHKYLDSTREAAIVGYSDVVVNGSINSQLDLNITREYSKDFPIGSLTATVLLEFPDATLTDKRVEYTYDIGTIETGTLRAEALS